MELASDLIKQFVDATNDSKSSTNNDKTLNATAVVNDMESLSRLMDLLSGPLSQRPQMFEMVIGFWLPSRIIRLI